MAKRGGGRIFAPAVNKKEPSTTRAADNNSQSRKQSIGVEATPSRRRRAAESLRRKGAPGNRTGAFPGWPNFARKVDKVRPNRKNIIGLQIDQKDTAIKIRRS